jgi:TATA-box binding protein (TBP) (component of TFIID and TFIIIB)
MASNIIETPGYPPAKIVNVVTTFQLGIRLNPTKIAFEMRDKIGLKFNPSRFAAATLNLETKDNNFTVALIFSSGKGVHTGAKTVNDNKQEEEKKTKKRNHHLYDYPPLFFLSSIITNTTLFFYQALDLTIVFFSLG